MDTMETFSLDPRRWRVGYLFSRNPLLRGSDRLEVLAVVFAVAVSLLALPIAAAKGTDVYQAHRALYAEQAQAGYRAPVRAAQPTSPAPLAADQDLGDPSIDGAGISVSRPTPKWQAGYDAVESVVMIEGLALVTMAALIATTRWLLCCIRYSQWNRALKSVLGDDGSRNH
jgi:hypothetical protein